MGHPSDPRLLVLHELRLKGLASADALVTGAAGSGVAPAEVTAWLERLAVEGLVAHHGGRRGVDGWTLTPAGRAEHARLVTRELAAAGVRPVTESAYGRFRRLNPDVLDVCSRWQVRDLAGRLVRNDHADHRYDDRVVADLIALHRRAVPLCDDLGDALDRYRRYGPQLDHAAERVVAGEGEWFTKPVLPSYHTVWFELHEDLLTTLGLDRAAEVAS